VPFRALLVRKYANIVVDTADVARNVASHASIVLYVSNLFVWLFIRFKNLIVLINRNLVVGNVNITHVLSNALNIAIDLVVMNPVGNVSRAAIHALDSVVKSALLFAVCATKTS
jgi:hypothetical protein